MQEVKLVMSAINKNHKGILTGQEVKYYVIKSHAEHVSQIAVAQSRAQSYASRGIGSFSPEPEEREETGAQGEHHELHHELPPTVVEGVELDVSALPTPPPASGTAPQETKKTGV